MQSKDIEAFKKFLDEKGGELSRFPELIPFFALPYFKDIKGHASYSHLFEKQWLEGVKKQLEQHIKHLLSSNSTELDCILHTAKLMNDPKMNLQGNAESIAQLDRVKKLEEQLREQKANMEKAEEDNKATLKDIHQKWANFVIKIIDVVKKFQLIVQNYSLRTDDQQHIFILQQQMGEYEDFLHQNLEDLFFEENFS